MTTATLASRKPPDASYFASNGLFIICLTCGCNFNPIYAERCHLCRVIVCPACDACNCEA